MVALTQIERFRDVGTLRCLWYSGNKGNYFSKDIDRNLDAKMAIMILRMMKL